MLVVLFAISVGACPVVPPTSVRVMDCRMATGLVAGIGRSGTLRALVTRVEQLGGLAYVTTAFEIRTRSNHRLQGRTWNVVYAAGRRRLVRLEVERRYDDDGVAVLAHELRHVVELLESNGRRTGDEVTAGVRETAEARSIQRAVARELRASKR
jgi:hypothetical protein